MASKNGYGKSYRKQCLRRLEEDRKTGIETADDYNEKKVAATALGMEDDSD